MPLSKTRNRDRMRQLRLHREDKQPVVQPKLPNGRYGIVESTRERVELDADGNAIPEF